MEADGSDEVLLIATASGGVLDPLDLGVYRFRDGVGDRMLQAGDDVVESSLEHLGSFDERRQAKTNPICTKNCHSVTFSPTARSSPQGKLLKIKALDGGIKHETQQSPTIHDIRKKTGQFLTFYKETLRRNRQLRSYQSLQEAAAATP